VLSFFTIYYKAKPAAQKEFVDLQAFAKETDGIEQLENGMVVIILKS
jgi:hypothetical protein